MLGSSVPSGERAQVAGLGEDQGEHNNNLGACIQQIKPHVQLGHRLRLGMGDKCNQSRQHVKHKIDGFRDTSIGRLAGEE